MTDTAPIDLTPQRRRRHRPFVRLARRVAGWLHLLFAIAIIAGVIVQVYLIGAYIFGAGQEALDLHKSLGWTVHGFEGVVMLAAISAWLPRVDLALSALLFVVGTAQVALASETMWIGGLHPLLALVVLSLAAVLTLRGIRRYGLASSARTRPP